jgi:predicted Fe-Mo cluster-binding NifX family protein
MPKSSFDDFAGIIARYQAPPTHETLQNLVVDAIDIAPDDVDEHVTDFARGRIELAYRTGNVETHLRHLYDVLAVMERELARG